MYTVCMYVCVYLCMHACIVETDVRHARHAIAMTETATNTHTHTHTHIELRPRQHHKVACHASSSPWLECQRHAFLVRTHWSSQEVPTPATSVLSLCETMPRPARSPNPPALSLSGQFSYGAVGSRMQVQASSVLALHPRSESRMLLPCLATALVPSHRIRHVAGSSFCLTLLFPAKTTDQAPGSLHLPPPLGDCHRHCHCCRRLAARICFTAAINMIVGLLQPLVLA
jgi:hypothetical protein